VTEGRRRRLIHGLAKQTLLCELHHSAVTKNKLSSIAKLSKFKLVFVLTLMYGYESEK